MLLPPQWGGGAKVVRKKRDRPPQRWPLLAKPSSLSDLWPTSPESPANLGDSPCSTSIPLAQIISRSPPFAQPNRGMSPNGGLWSQLPTGQPPL